MAMLDIKGVHIVRSKGRTYVYAWRGGPRLESEMGTPEFVQELADVSAARRTGDSTKLASLCIALRSSDYWTKEISAKTRQNWTPWLDRIQVKFGKISIAAFDRPLIKVAIRKWRDEFKATPRSADVGLEVFSVLLAFGVNEGRLMSNAVAGMPRLYKSNRSMLIWTDADLAQFEAVASPQLIRAIRLAALTGLRTADLLRLSWVHVKPNSIEITTGKSTHRKETLIPIYGALRAHLESIERSNKATTILTNEDGLPWKTGFGSSFQKAKKRAKIDVLHFHDTRGTAATRMYVGGLTVREIAEIFTWSEDYTEAMINKYVKKDELLRDRIRRLDEAERRTSSVKPAVKPSPAKRAK